MSYVYLGYGTTNSEGVAHLDHDADGEPISHSYTGVGAGEIDVVASLDNPVDESSIVSEPYSVWDVIKYDDATINSHDDTLWQSLTYLSRGEEYSTFTFSSSQTLYTSVSSDVTIEFDVNLVCANSSPFISLRKLNDLLTAVTKQNLSITNDNWYHIKISIVNSVATVTNTTNDVTIPNLTVTDVNRFYFRNGSNEQVRFKNFKVYNS